MKIINRLFIGYLAVGVLWSASSVRASETPAVPSMPGQNAVTAPSPQPPQPLSSTPGNVGSPTAMKKDMHGAPILIVEFQTDHYDIPTSFTPQLKAFGRYLKRHPNSTATIAGHADNSGHGPANDTLSEKRADAVMAYLVSHYGISANRIKTSGYGATLDKPSNSTIEAQQYDRRAYGTISTNS